MATNEPGKMKVVRIRDGEVAEMFAMPTYGGDYILWRENHLTKKGRPPQNRYADGDLTAQPYMTTWARFDAEREARATAVRVRIAELSHEIALKERELLALYEAPKGE